MSAGGRRRQLLRVPVEDVPRRSLVELGSGEESRPAFTAASAPSPPPPPPGSTTGGSSPAPESGPPASASSPGSGPPSSRPSGSAPASAPPPAPSRPPPPPWPTDPSPPPTDEPRDELDQEIAEDAFLDDPRPSTAPTAAMAAGGRPAPPEDEATPPPGEVGPVSGTPPSQAAPGSSEPSPPSPSVPPASSPASTEAPASSSGAPGGDEADASAPGEGTDDGDDGLELEELAATSAPHPTPPPVPGTKTAPPPPPAVVQAAVAGPPTEPRHRAPASSSPPPANGSRPTPPPPTRPRKRRTRPWFEDFFNDDYVRTVPPPRRDHIAQEIDFIEASLGLAKGATILDVGCGTGLHAVELAARGYLVVGLDLSLPMLSRAADEAQERGTKINFLHGDMREMSFEGAFDAVLCWGTTFGYFDDESNRRVVERLYAALKPMGLLLLDVVNRDFVIGRQPNLVWFEGDGCVCMEETQFNYITSRLEVKRTVILDDGRQRETPYGIRLYALHELGQLLHQQGFRVAQVSGERATPGVFFGADSSRMLILAERRLPSGGASPPSPPEEALTGTTSRVPDDAAPEDPPADDEPFD